MENKPTIDEKIIENKEEEQKEQPNQEQKNEIQEEYQQELSKAIKVREEKIQKMNKYQVWYNLIYANREVMERRSATRFATSIFVLAITIFFIVALIWLIIKNSTSLKSMTKQDKIVTILSAILVSLMFIFYSYDLICTILLKNIIKAFNRQNYQISEENTNGLIEEYDETIFKKIKFYVDFSFKRKPKNFM